MNRDLYLHFEWEQILLALNLLSSFKRRSTGVLVGRCIFHNEKSPSLHFWSTSKRFHCHGCGADGDMIDFVALYKGFDSEGERSLEILKNFFQHLPPVVTEGQLRFTFDKPAL